MVKLINKISSKFFLWVDTYIVVLLYGGDINQCWPSNGVSLMQYADILICKLVK